MKEDKKFLIIFTLIFIIWFLSIVIATKNKVIVKKNYIQNIETKLNIYEQSYDNFVLEDNKNQ